jgi:hypothetical protein
VRGPSFDGMGVDSLGIGSSNCSDDGSAQFSTAGKCSVFIRRRHSRLLAVDAIATSACEVRPSSLC